MAQIAYVTNAPPQSGMGKPAREICAGIRNMKHEERVPLALDVDLFEMNAGEGTLSKNGENVARASQLPGPLGVKPVQWWRLSRRLPKTGYDLWHLTNQTLSFLQRQPSIITVYDIIELLDPQERLGNAVARFLYGGIPRAKQLICISEYTKKTVQEVYEIPNERITVIPLGVRSSFTGIPHVRQTIAYHEFLREQKLTDKNRILLYVGSDHPRKNLRMLAEALARVRKDLPETILLKVGDPGLKEGREAFLHDLDRLGLRDSVRFIGNVGDEQLQLFYSLADVFVFPSTFEGFGIPPLEAMACGCPVVCSNATSLPEVVGDAAMLCDPQDADAFARGIVEVLTKPDVAANMRKKGLARAPQFFWEGIAERTLEVYRRILAA
jgi:glycosyltransferase involved in cell wall biosynthesis